MECRAEPQRSISASQKQRSFASAAASAQDDNHLGKLFFCEGCFALTPSLLVAPTAAGCPLGAAAGATRKRDFGDGPEGERQGVRAEPPHTLNPDHSFDFSASAR